MFPTARGGRRGHAGKLPRTLDGTGMPGIASEGRGWWGMVGDRMGPWGQHGNARVMAHDVITILSVHDPNWTSAGGPSYWTIIPYHPYSPHLLLRAI